jgi:hypothetical protein
MMARKNRRVVEWCVPNADLKIVGPEHVVDDFRRALSSYEAQHTQQRELETMAMTARNEAADLRKQLVNLEANLRRCDVERIALKGQVDLMATESAAKALVGRNEDDVDNIRSLIGIIESLAARP